jgi:hypothetical protein
MEVEDYPLEIRAGVPLIRIVGDSDDRLIAAGDTEDEDSDDAEGDASEDYDSAEEDDTPEVCDLLA